MSGSVPSLLTLAEASPLAMVIWDTAGTIFDANRAFYQLLGHDMEAALAERPALDYWSVTAPAQKQREINHLLTKEREPYYKEFVTRDGALQSVQANGFVLHREENAMRFAAVIRAITAEARSEQAEHGRALRRQNELLLKLTRSTTIDLGDFKSAIREITEATAQGLAVTRASVWLYDGEKRRIICQDLYELDKRQHSDGVTLRAEDFPRYFAALAEDRAITADDAHNHPATAEFSSVYLAPLEIQSMLEAPLRYKGELVGVLCHEHCRDRRSWTQEDVTFAGHMADFVARAMEAKDRRRAERALQKVNSELERRVDERARKLQEATELVLRLQKDNTETQMAAGFAHEMYTALNSANVVIRKITGRGSDSDETPAADLSPLLNELFLIMQERFDEPAMERARDLFGSLIERAETIADVCTMVSLSIEHALKITNEILDYSRMGQANPGNDECALGKIIGSVLDDIGPQLEQNQIELSCDLSGPPVLYGTERHYHAVVKHIVSNACDALTELSEDRPRKLSVRYQAVPAGVVLTVEDNGVGMPGEVRARIFDPFFTTRPRTRIGLGLGMVRKIMSIYEGSIDVSSVAGEGTRVKLLFPGKRIVGSV